MLQPTPESPIDRRRFRQLALACVGLATVSLTILIIEQGWGVLGRLSAIAGSAQVVGKWLIFVGVKQDNPSGFGPWGIAYAIFMLDLLLALVLNSFLPQIERLPYAGPWLVRTRERAGRTFAGYPKLRRMAWSGVALWVLLPLPASGAVTGSFASRIGGLSRFAATLAIAVGSGLNCALFAGMAQWLGASSQELLDNWKVTVASAIVAILLMWWAWRRLVKHLREDN